jgi:outer membrane protein
MPGRHCSTVSRPPIRCAKPKAKCRPRARHCGSWKNPCCSLAIRLNKESEGQQRLNVEQVRDQTQANVIQAWGQLQAAKAQVEAAIRQNDAAARALEGVRNEAQAGQRTTLDVLNAEQALVNARVSLIIAQHDRVVASYSLVSAVGRLSAQELRLPVTIYDPMVHYQQVRDAWFGLRTPDGR